MVTLTFRSKPAQPKKVFRKWLLRQPWHDTTSFCYAWFLEFQRRKVVHFHVLIGRDAFESYPNYEQSWYQTVRRRRRERLVLRGPVDARIVADWIDCVGDTSSKFVAFQNGGICEPLRTVDGAARYAATYAGKEEQKTLPADAPPLGRWWYISRAATPKAEKVILVENWPFQRKFSLIYDKAAIVEANPNAAEETQQ